MSVRWPKVLLLLVGLSGPGVGAAEAQEQGRVLATTSGRTLVAAHGDMVAYSKRDPTTGRYRLMAGRLGGAFRALNVRDRSIAFDVDLGPGKGGALTAVYSRCRAESPDIDAYRGRGCRLYRYVFREGREQELKRLSDAAGSEYLPTVWGDRIAYASRGSSARSRLFLADPAGARERLPAGPVGSASSFASPLAMDLRAGRLAFTWATSPDICPSYTIDPEAREEPYATALYVTALRSSAERLFSACNQTTERLFLAGAAWNAGSPLTGVVNVAPVDIGRQARFALRVVTVERTGGPRTAGGYSAGEQYADNLAIAGSTLIAAVRLVPENSSKRVSRVVALPLTAPSR